MLIGRFGIMIPALALGGVLAAKNTVPAGAFRGYGLSQTVFAVESAIDELARLCELDPADFRRRNLIRAGDAPDNASAEPAPVSTAT